MRRWIDASAGSPPPRADHAATFAYGLAQPLLGLRMLHRHPDLLRPMLVPLMLVAAFCTLAAFDLDEEAALVADHPVLFTGFGVAVAGLLAVPIVNLLLRPAVLLGSVHVLGRVREPARADNAQTGPDAATAGSARRG